MSQDKKLTNNVGTPVVDNQNIMTAGPRGPALLLDYHVGRFKRSGTGTLP